MQISYIHVSKLNISSGLKNMSARIQITPIITYYTVKYTNPYSCAIRNAIYAAIVKLDMLLIYKLKDQVWNRKVSLSGLTDRYSQFGSTNKCYVHHTVFFLLTDLPKNSEQCRINNTEAKNQYHIPPNAKSRQHYWHN